jgi:hypothetical protein
MFTEGTALDPGPDPDLDKTPDFWSAATIADVVFASFELIAGAAGAGLPGCRVLVVEPWYEAYCCWCTEPGAMMMVFASPLI